ncbi:hypothetical protein COU97_01010 [Candidatus Shapirobacteria bacterium CG10_big_fil_rev_8_21_14_0_10_48_15]|uniref:Uncharacterized protein n=1 Tax=Candidatus Shapirobacteria bacterium CG10_big_fil_rev_8_21_14_0_10_48_15 TaxID=1974484 RepID=A0A2M8L7L2_9BACT|nr:MAG: hypothetical protein COU97_01010 [Candidatus Shapirobacteria bacterium CG10_big_fil_rev_8_21_14_0_10_48_15]
MAPFMVRGKIGVRAVLPRSVLAGWWNLHPAMRVMKPTAPVITPLSHPPLPTVAIWAKVAVGERLNATRANPKGKVFWGCLAVNVFLRTTALFMTERDVPLLAKKSA